MSVPLALQTSTADGLICSGQATPNHLLQSSIRVEAPNWEVPGPFVLQNGRFRPTPAAASHSSGSGRNSQFSPATLLIRQVFARIRRVIPRAKSIF